MRQKIKLTKTTIDATEIKPRAYFLWCSELPGFGVRVFPSGRKVFYADYYDQDGKRSRMSIGAYGKLTPDEARKQARIILGDVLKGGNPALERKTRRLALTVGELCDDYMRDAEHGLILGRSGKPKKPSTLETDRGRIERHIKPLLGGKRVIDLKQTDVARFLHDVSTGKTAKVEKTAKLRGKAVVDGGAGTASRTTGLLGGILSYAVTKGIIPANPAHGVKRPADNRKERRLDAEEYRRLGEALDTAHEEPWQSIAFIRLLALTGCRRGEIANLKWAEVDLEKQVLKLGDSKTGVSVRPLGISAVDVLNRLPRTPGNPHVLTGVRDPSQPYGGMVGAMERLTRSAGLADVTAHVLRHSFASVAADLDYSDSTIGAMLGHAGTTITSRYTHRLDSVLVAAANKVCGEVHRQMTGESGKVLEMPRRA
ncbi:tyrosine-type recombinase/integrase [Nitratireductor aquimarinus]|uniref:Tyrosine-type recombinase/integrase n=1 Tax=Nitratireductor aquimarinus TaxID=889300 RepID=A0ABU4AJ87_9HYPH|nr:tyrosine-type recombinase/integrase [Nitratireductor aquimarinus]MDV6226315.1 tyrosine-type recombinase/integrase [Nitratireductor aquimarinus]